ncbi:MULTISPECIES: ABC transporter ATP-binding protein [unclassified Streptomyces]|uniref:ABC transporter ATP-binding protein n=1 Tax=unclassified Streptomyces TaxID=2593676 RepID=UPI001BEC5CF3|nr:MULTISPECIES: ATP-binding cassette domain-containing protein [unclassified Streptomyces]MBT2406037.1 ATP-binding cassette domain-containing protein [Streptomyces sp. ISL-21]MBT2453558.1 ATP-binding cassette domain-containing protein [Streptomyces sp. ISL-86]MBT2610639.1 ATP-binding cassette domain-containing protein [Streptomyces sp. ISL-87]
MVAPPDNAPPDNDVLWARSLHYSHSGSPGLIGVSVGVRQGEILALTGPRGSGKTTLLRCLYGQLVPDQGEVWFNSVPVHTMGAVARQRLRRDRFGWIGPEPQLLPELKVWENAALPLLIAGAPHRAAKRAACEWLDRLDIGGFARKRPGALSRAESQRVTLARALVNEPAVIFADEPTAPLHRAERSLLLRTLTTAARSHGITVLFATHDEETAAAADRRVALVDGRPAGAAAATAAAPSASAASAASSSAPATAASASASSASAENLEDQAACSLSA